MTCQNIILIMVLIVICIIVIATIQNNNTNEQFDSISDTTIPPFYSYYRYPRSKFQINQVHNPFYNYPEYIGKYPYYKYMFSPYSSSVYYT